MNRLDVFLEEATGDKPLKQAGAVYLSQNLLYSNRGFNISLFLHMVDSMLVIDQ